LHLAYFMDDRTPFVKSKMAKFIHKTASNLIKDQETTIVPNEHEFVEHKKLEKRA
ncbi:8444_t:CDS:2, partial [Gigaspora rosea]